jgi:membrane fusion protein, heavy metal efflux system
MKPRSLIVLLLVLALGAGAVFFTWRYARPVTAASHDDHGHGHGHGHDDHDEKPPAGPHGGRLLRDGDFALELAIFERGVPPEYRAYPSLGARPVALGEVDVTVMLTRFGGREDVIRFKPEGDYLVGDREVVEPHSFAVNVVARHAGREHVWRYDSFEGRVELSAAAAVRAGVTTAIAGPATLRETLTVPGRVTLNADTIARVTPRYAGLVKSVAKQLGDRVTAGEVLAVIEANDSLQTYEIRAPRDGTVITRNVTVGGFAAAGDELYTVADLSTVWVELLVPRADAGRVQAGQAVTLTGSGLPETTATIATLPPFGYLASRPVHAGGDSTR